MKTFHISLVLPSCGFTVLIFVMLWIIPSTLLSQRYISGYITDAGNGESIPGASVFIPNTSIGITTDAEGHYRLRIPGEGSYQLTVSHVGYQTVVKDIEPGKTTVQFDIDLRSVELEEVTVSARVRFRRTDINLFWRTILGKNPSKRTILSTNAEKVFYYYNSETRILKVTCHEPLQIVNYETGYHIQYVLDNFTHNYNTGITEWSYKHVFSELKPDNPRQQNDWEKKRKEVYSVSLTKFIKSLYNNSLKEDGFVLTNIRVNPQDQSNPFTLTFLNPNSLLSATSTDNSRTFNLSKQKLLLFCYGKSVTENDSVIIERSQYPAGQFGASFDLGRGATTVSQYTKGEQLDKNGLYRSLLQGKSIRIFPDGTFMGELSMGNVNDASSSPLMGLSMRLPVEYDPEGSIPLTMSQVVEEIVTDFAQAVQYFNNQLSIFPQEKIHLHTDRDIYVSGEKIWFKAYVTDAHTHQGFTQSRYVYVELISPTDTLINRVMVRPADGMFYGNIPLLDYVPTGNYTLRAYTRYMENLGDDYFFKKNIRIENLLSATNQQRPTAQRGKLTDDFDVSFFPEGGNLPEGVLSRVAFKAININGYPENVSGKLIDEKGLEITSVESSHAGMGVFNYTPSAGKRVFLQCKNTNDLEKRFELPRSNPRAYSLTVHWNNDEHLIGVNRSVQAPDIPYYLLAHCRGKVLYFSEWNKEYDDVVFVKEDLPAGIIQFVLLDKQMNPLSERLVFSKNEVSKKVEFHTDKTSYEKRGKVIASLQSPSPLGRDGVFSHLSVAITDDKDIAIDSSTTIHSTLLLSSELKGYIENPAWYLQDDTASAVALDYLMLTHGWRRYDIPDVMKGNPKSSQIPFQISQEITGNVKSPARSRPVAGNEVLIMLDESNYEMTSTDENGKFIVQDFEYPDSTTYFLRALSNRVNDRIDLVLDRVTFPKLIYAPQNPVSTNTPLAERDNESASRSDAFMAKTEQRARYDEDMWILLLDEVEVTARRIERKKEEPRLQFWANASSDATIRRDEIERLAYRNVVDYLRRVPGVRVSGDPDSYGQKSIINIRGSNSFQSGTAPLVLVDGVPQPPGFDLNDLRTDEIESIDVFKGVSTSAFGMQGGNGVINITTRIGGGNSTPERETNNYTAYTPLGYQKPVEFYAPKYETLEAKNSAIPDYRTTIFWKPDVVISEDEENAIFEFYTSDFTTTYSVVIEGLTMDGKIIRQIEKIHVK
ncbi:MAG: carboxypeptidase-like regulatory domain-containing protein [Tannerella sp.]|jgi:hypothetical protein|nr:carboxypeptidase-like regulatory domain-containing protein [Tannerella sp.]